MKNRVICAAVASVTLVVGVGIGVTGARENAKDDGKHIMYAGTKTTPALVSQILTEATNAQRYADWCGGYVQVIGTDITVLNCDK